MTTIIQKWNVRYWCSRVTSYSCLALDRELCDPAWTQRQEVMFKQWQGISWWKVIGVAEGMGHRRVRKIDLTVNLIYRVFPRCPVSIKPAHKQDLSSCIFGSTPSNHCCPLTGNNGINTPGCSQRICVYPKSFVLGVQWVLDTKELKNNDPVQ